MQNSQEMSHAIRRAAEKARSPAIFAKRVSVCFYGDQSWLLPHSRNTPRRRVPQHGVGSIKRRWRQFYAVNGGIQRAAWERTPREAAERG